MWIVSMQEEEEQKSALVPGKIKCLEERGKACVLRISWQRRQKIPQTVTQTEKRFCTCFSFVPTTDACWPDSNTPWSSSHCICFQICVSLAEGKCAASQTWAEGSAQQLRPSTYASECLNILIVPSQSAQPKGPFPLPSRLELHLLISARSWVHGT